MGFRFSQRYAPLAQVVQPACDMALAAMLESSRGVGLSHPCSWKR
jgi:hypothetical protein